MQMGFPMSVGLKGFRRHTLIVALATSAAILAGTAAGAQTLGYAPQASYIANENLPSQLAPQIDENESADAALPDRLRRAIIDYRSSEAPGTVVIDTANTTLYYILGNGRAVRYGVGVGREGFTWAGTQTVTRKAEWPDWHPPAEMIARQPYLPRFMAGGPGNPLGARAMYLGSSVYRIHGTNDPSTIGKFVSSGCIRLTNEDVTDLFSRVTVGTKVIVLPKAGTQGIEARGAVPSRAATNVRNQRQAMSASLSSVN
jgi:lipoprotein-anchoring transpeptidase ErfK/SrfK